MRKSDAQKILIGAYKFDEIVDGKIRMVGYEDSDYYFLKLSDKDIEFCLRQLALKVVREKGK